MGREAISAGALAFVALIGAAGCATNPKQTVMNLDTTDRKWGSRQCVAARKAVYEFNDHNNLRTVVRTAGNIVVPFAGLGASIALTGGQQRQREALNDRVLHACVSNRQKAELEEEHDRHRVVAAFQR